MPAGKGRLRKSLGGGASSRATKPPSAMVKPARARHGGKVEKRKNNGEPKIRRFAHIEKAGYASSADIGRKTREWVESWDTGTGGFTFQLGATGLTLTHLPGRAPILRGAEIYPARPPPKASGNPRAGMSSFNDDNAKLVCRNMNTGNAIHKSRKEGAKAPTRQHWSRQNNITERLCFGLRPDGCQCTTA